MKVTVVDVEGGKKKLTVEVAPEEIKPFENRALDRLASKHQIPGFRPGKAPRELLQSRFGTMAVLEEALQELVSKTLFDALREQSIDSVGEPQIAVEKMAPGNAVVYTATVSVMPAVTLGDWRGLSVAKQAVTVTDEEVTKALDELRDLAAKEALVLRPAKAGDRVEINFDITRDGVVIEGGSGRKFPVVLGKKTLVPGFEEHVMGMSAGEKKNFSLTFPTPYFQEQLAGALVSVAVECLNVYERNLPELTDEWAQTMMGKSLADLRAAVRDNMHKERESEARSRFEHDAVEKIMSVATFGIIPETLIAHEIEKMIAELEHDVASRGMQWERYLESIKRTMEDLRHEFKEQATKRTKAALLLRQLAAELKIALPDSEIDAEWSQHKERYKDNAEARESVGKREYRAYLARVLTNRKTLDAVVDLVHVSPSGT